MTVYAYIRCSTGEQADSGLGLEAQARVIARECEQRGLVLGESFVDAGFSGKDLKRPELTRALKRLAPGDTLIAAKLDRLSRSLYDFAGLMERSRNEGWRLLVLDSPVDTSSPAGEVMASVLASFAQFERRLISQRTREALAEKKAQGVKLGRPSLLTEDERRHVIELAEAHGYCPAARLLNAEGARTGAGGRQWYGSSVRSLVMSA